VSHYQGTIDWAQVAASGIQFAMCKATEGTTYTDPTLSYNYNGMKTVRMIAQRARTLTPLRV